MEKELRCPSLALWGESARESCKTAGGNNTRTPGMGILELGKAWKGWAHAGTQPAGRGDGHFHGTPAQGDIFQCARWEKSTVPVPRKEIPKDSETFPKEKGTFPGLTQEKRN